MSNEPFKKNKKQNRKEKEQNAAEDGKQKKMWSAALEKKAQAKEPPAPRLTITWVWLKIQEGQTAGFGPYVHLPGFHFGTGFLSSHMGYVGHFGQAMSASEQQMHVGSTKNRGVHGAWLR